MTDFFSIANANFIASLAAVATALLGIITYFYQKVIDLNFKKEELKREAVTEYLSSLDALINHAAFKDGLNDHDEAEKILKCKQRLNAVYIYAPTKSVVAMNKLMTEAIALASIISKIPNSEIFKEEQKVKYKKENDLTQAAYMHAINVARDEIGLHSGKVEEVQLLIMGAQ